MKVNFIAAFLIFQMGAFLVLMSAIYKDFLRDAKRDKSLTIVALIAKIGYFAAIIAVLLATLFAILGKFGKLECQNGAFLPSNVRDALNVGERKVFFETGVAVKRTAGVIGIEHREPDCQVLPDFQDLRKFFEFHVEDFEVAWLDHKPLLLVERKDVNCLPRRGGTILANKVYELKDADFFLGVVHQPNRPIAFFRKQSANDYARVPLRHKIFPHDLQRLFGRTHHPGSLISQVKGGKHHQHLHDQNCSFHSHSLASASELDRILREGLRGREG